MEIGAVILAGGNSKRMGKDKLFLPIGGKPLFERVLEVCLKVFEEVIVVCKTPELFTAYPVPVYKDLVDAGVLGGLYTGLKSLVSRKGFCVASDMPFLKVELVVYLASLSNGYDAVVPKGPDGLHPLCAVYDKNCLQAMESNIAKGDFKISSVFPSLKVRFCEPEEVAKVDPCFLSFFNVNTPKDLSKAESLLEAKRCL